MSGQGQLRRGRILRGLGGFLVVIGATLVLLTGGLLAYGQYERWQFETEEAATVQAEIAEATASARLVTGAHTNPATPAPTSVLSPLSSRVPAVASPQTSSRTALPTVTLTASPAPVPRRIIAPSIKLDSRIVESSVVNGEWTVPKFVAGHLVGTANPGENGNMALSGHIESISSGNVFAEIGRLNVGDDIFIQGGQTWYRYVVVETKSVPNTDLTVLDPLGYPSLTLITCTGTWLPLARDYDRRLIVLARLDTVVPEDKVPRFAGP